MSDTPLTDAVGINHATATENEYKLRKVARKLECENARLRELVRVQTDALRDMTDRYCALVNSGDAGFWDPEKEPQVIAARAALAQTEQSEGEERK